MTGRSVTTLEDFQLSMLHAMCEGAPARAAGLLERIGATRAEAAVAEKRWWYADKTNEFTSIAEYVTAWGASAADRIERHEHGETRWAAWDLPLWGFPGGMDAGPRAPGSFRPAIVAVGRTGARLRVEALSPVDVYGTRSDVRVRFPNTSVISPFAPPEWDCLWSRG